MRATPVVDGRKRCSACGEEKDLADFAASSRARLGRSHHCKPCRRAYVNARNALDLGRADRLREYRLARPRDLLRRQISIYGLTLEAYDAMVDAQRGRCAACGSPPTRQRLDVDHDHQTGKVRGLLCNPCNIGIGHLRHDPERLRLLIVYLEGTE